MQERMRVARKESIIDEEVFFDRELWITTLKVASTIIAYAMAQDQILGARWCANWICLDKAQALDRTRQRHGAEQCPRYRVFAKLCKGDRMPGQDVYPLTRASPFVSAWQFPNDAFWRVSDSAGRKHERPNPAPLKHGRPRVLRRRVASCLPA